MGCLDLRHPDQEAPLAMLVASEFLKLLCEQYLADM